MLVLPKLIEFLQHHLCLSYQKSTSTWSNNLLDSAVVSEESWSRLRNLKGCATVAVVSHLGTEELQITTLLKFQSSK